MAHAWIVIRQDFVESARAVYAQQIWGSDKPNSRDFCRVFVHRDAAQPVLRALIDRLDEDQSSWAETLGEGFEVHLVNAPESEAEAALQNQMAERGYHERLAGDVHEAGGA